MGFINSLIESLAMPRIRTDGVPDAETARHIREAYREVDAGPRVGIIEERNTGTVPIQLDRNPPYQGVTEFKPVYTPHGPDVRTTRMGISDRLRRYVRVGRRVINNAKRVGRHESMHVLSEKLLKYMDVTEHVGKIIMESYAEFGGMKARPHERDDILLTTPYPPAVKFGMYANRFYESEIDGAQGYAAFIRDIQKYGSARSTLMNLGRNIRAARGRGIDVVGAVEKEYRTSLRKAWKNAGLPAAA